jgi:dTDP-glucose 4,6-dehydratase
MTRVIAVTGALGFIGSHVVEALLWRGDLVCAIDSETYAANRSLPDTPLWYNATRAGALKYEKADICTIDHLPDVDAIIHLAAETHVDNSLLDAERFVRTNFLGTAHLLELARGKRAYQIPTFLYVSTDEVYGSVPTGSTTETSPLRPSSPYAASKAAGDLLVQAYGHSFGIPFRIVRPSNCYGPRQHPEKLIPKAIRHLALGRLIPIHEGGNASRSWLDVKDCAQAILTVLDAGKNGETYNIGGAEMSVRGVATLVCEALGIERPGEHMDFGYTRLGLDTRYRVDDSKLRALGWEPQGDLKRDLPALSRAERATLRW